VASQNAGNRYLRADHPLGDLLLGVAFFVHPHHAVAVEHQPRAAAEAALAAGTCQTSFSPI
jgi:hypothetical protein